MRRVIRTEFYFPNVAEGICFAWFKTPTDEELDTEEKLGKLVDYPAGRRLIIRSRNLGRSFVETEAGRFITRVISRDLFFEVQPRFLDEEVIIESSPPLSVPLRDLLASGAVSLGSFYSAADGNTPLMLIKIAGGMIVIGAARGISNALKNGLQETIEDFFRRMRSKARNRTAGRATKKKPPEK